MDSSQISRIRVTVPVTLSMMYSLLLEHATEVARDKYIFLDDDKEPQVGTRAVPWLDIELVSIEEKHSQGLVAVFGSKTSGRSCDITVFIYPAASTAGPNKHFKCSLTMCASNDEGRTSSFMPHGPQTVTFDL